MRFSISTGLVPLLVGLTAGGCIGAQISQPTIGATASADEAPPAKPAYMIVLGTVTDRDAFTTGYAAHLPPLYEKYGGRYLAIGGAPDVLEGETAPGSHVIAEWPNREAAQAFWDSPEYVALREARIEGGWGTFDVFLVEGLSTPTQVAPLAREANK